MRIFLTGMVIGCAMVAAGCGSDPTQAAATADEGATADAGQGPPTGESTGAMLSASDRDAVMKAAGYDKVGGKWLSNCDDTGDAESWEGTISHIGDLTGDGTPEAIVEGGNSACFGMVGTGYAIVMKSGEGWKSVLDSNGIAQVFPQRGKPVPMIEIGGPGSSCFPMHRWNGSSFKHVGYSVGGRVCEELRFSKIGGLPIGYYERPRGCPRDGLNETCVAYLADDRLVDVASGDFVAMKPLGAKRYQLTQSFPDEEGTGESRSSDVIEVGNGYGFRYLNDEYVFVPRDRVPPRARLLDLPQYRGDPRFDAVRR